MGSLVSPGRAWGGCFAPGHALGIPMLRNLERLVDVRANASVDGDRMQFCTLGAARHVMGVLRANACLAWFRGRNGCVWFCGVCHIGRPMDATLVWRIIISDVAPASTTLRVWLPARLGGAIRAASTRRCHPGSAVPVTSAPAMTSRSVAPRARFGVPVVPTAATRSIAAPCRAQIERS